MSIFTQKTQITDEQKKQIAGCDTTPLKYLDDLINSSKAKQEPIEIKLNPTQVCDKATQQHIDLGNKLLQEHKVALLIMSGGAATRLGADVPKGQYHIGLPGFSCLFEVLLNKCKELHNPLVIIMLSNATKNAVAFLESKQFFGYPQEQVKFVFQPEYPVISETKEFLLDDKSNIQTSPNGNGGFLKAVSSIDFKGIEYLHVIGVDNPFVKPVDPGMIGFAAQNKFQVINRCLRPQVGEKVGIQGMRQLSEADQAPLCPGEITKLLQKPCVSVFEYSEIDMNKIKPTEQFGSIANHTFSIEFLKPLIEIQERTGKYITPYHLAYKKVPYYDTVSKQMVTPKECNAYKVEHFIFDYFHFCPFDKFGLFVCSRDEFVPIKEPSDVEKIKATWK